MGQVGKVAKYIITERIITGLAHLVSVGMIYFIWTDPEYGVYKAFFFMTPVYLAICVATVYISDLLMKKGYDVTGVEELRLMVNRPYTQGQYVKRFVQWILKRKLSIFFIGSCFHLDPPYVTLLLRDKNKGLMANSLLITTPSVILSMFVWTVIFWSAFRGYEWVRWFM